MNKLSITRRANVIRALVEGGSLRSVARMTGTDKDTVMRLLVEVREFCSIYQYHALVNFPAGLTNHVWTVEEILEMMNPALMLGC